MIIYKATNKINGKIYIGQTIQKLKKRLDQHKYQIKNKNYPFPNAIRKYGIENFKWKTIDRADNIKELNKKEIYWINKYNSTKKKYGYNVEVGGLNSIVSEETKQKLKNREYKPSSEIVQNLINWNKAHPKRDPCKKSTKRKIGIGNKGKIRSEEYKKKMRLTKIGTVMSKESSIKKRLATQGEKSYSVKITEKQAIDIIERLKRGEKQADLAREHNISDGAIYRLKKGLSWKYLQCN